jgi:hypothetical protein
VTGKAVLESRNGMQEIDEKLVAKFNQHLTVKL